jgi:hypothetical protein
MERHGTRRGRSRPTVTSSELPAVASITDAQRRVLVALCRPYATSDGFAVPATNQQIARDRRRAAEPQARGSSSAR